MSKIKNPDIAAAVAMALALLVEIAGYVAEDESLLAMLPPWLGPLVVFVAASARYRIGTPSGDPVPAPVDDETTEPIEVSE